MQFSPSLLISLATLLTAVSNPVCAQEYNPIQARAYNSGWNAALAARDAYAEPEKFESFEKRSGYNVS